MGNYYGNENYAFNNVFVFVFFIYFRTLHISTVFVNIILNVAFYPYSCVCVCLFKARMNKLVDVCLSHPDLFSRVIKQNHVCNIS